MAGFLNLGEYLGPVPLDAGVSVKVLPNAVGADDLAVGEVLLKGFGEGAFAAAGGTDEEVVVRHKPRGEGLGFSLADSGGGGRGGDAKGDREIGLFLGGYGVSIQLVSPASGD